MEYGRDGVEAEAQMCVILYQSFIVYIGVEGEGRGCERLRI